MNKFFSFLFFLTFTTLGYEAIHSRLAESLETCTRLCEKGIVQEKDIKNCTAIIAARNWWYFVNYNASEDRYVASNGFVEISFSHESLSKKWKDIQGFENRK